MDLTWMLIIWLVLGCSVIYIMLMGPTNPQSPVGALYKFVSNDVWDYANKAVEYTLGKWAARQLSHAFSYIFNSANPIVQIFFLILYVGGFYLFYKAATPYLPNLYISEAQVFISIPATFLVTMYFFCKASFTDPGRIYGLSGHKSYPYDYILFEPSVCKTCLHQKPARSKHCSMCKACISLHDHHCIWINNCIGMNNHKYFVGFLVSVAWTCLYGIYVLTSILQYWLESKNVFAKLHSLTTFQGLQTLTLLCLRAQTNLFVLLLFITICLVIVSIFLAYHLWILSNGTTTNEHMKWNAIEAYFSDKDFKRVNIPKWNLYSKEVPKTFDPADEKQYVAVSSFVDINNIYSLDSAYKNIHSILFATDD